MKRVIFMTLVLAFASMLMASEPIGVVVNNNTNCFQFINPVTQELSAPQLKGFLGSYDGGLFDVVITNDGKTAIISNFNDATIYFVDISGGFNGTPTIKGSTFIRDGHGNAMYAEDLEITPDDKYVLVTDGGFSPKCAIVDIATMEMVAMAQFTGASADEASVMGVGVSGLSAQAVAMAPNGKTVLFADYFGAKIHSLTFNNGKFTYVASIDLVGNRPVNVSISPDGRTAIAVSANTYKAPLIALYSDGTMDYKGDVTLSAKGGQSCVFSKDGSKAYYLNNSVLFGTVVSEINITGQGQGTLGQSVQLSIPRGTSQLFGVDTMAIDPSGNYLYVTNPTVSIGSGVVEMTVIDLATGAEVNQLHCNGIPAGVCFGTIQ